MQIIKFRDRQGTVHVGILSNQQVHTIKNVKSGSLSVSQALQTPIDQLKSSLSDSCDQASIQEFLAPLDEQEIWGAGVTYLRSKKAREDESEQAATFYDQVYQADRPELFFKATPHRVVGSGKPIRVRADSNWTVPEPELALFLSPQLELIGYTLGNDVSARDIEGRNPLYLPQAKLYDACCAIGPAVTPAALMPKLADVEIRLSIERQGKTIFDGGTSVGRMARGVDELIAWLGRDNSFPNGVILLTGTGIVPPDDFTLQAGDIVTIASEPIGQLVNSVVQGSA